MSTVASTVRELGFVGKALALVRKDLKVEFRSRDTLPPMLAFAVTVVLLLAFSLPSGTEIARPASTPLGTVPVADVLSGFFWITVLFAGLVAFARTFEIERQDAAMDALLLVPVDRSALFLAKAASNLIYVSTVQLFLVPSFLLLFHIDLGAGWWAFILVVLLADVGFVSIGTLFASLAAQTTSRELMLPILALPILVPVFIAAAEMSSDLFLGGGFASIAERGWFGIIVAFDLIFVIVGSLTFEYGIER